MSDVAERRQLAEALGLVPYVGGDTRPWTSGNTLAVARPVTRVPAHEREQVTP